MLEKWLIAVVMLCLLILSAVSFVDAAGELLPIPEVGPAVCAWRQNNNPSSPRCDERTQRCAQGCPAIARTQAITSSGNTNQESVSISQQMAQFKRTVKKNINQHYGRGSLRITTFEKCLSSKTGTKECGAAIQQCKNEIDSKQSGLDVFKKKCSGICRSTYNNCRIICGGDKSCFKYNCQIPGEICLTSCNAQLNNWWPSSETSTGQDAGNTQLNDRMNDFMQKCESGFNGQDAGVPSENAIPFSTNRDSVLTNNQFYNKLSQILKEKGHLSADEVSIIKQAINAHKKAFKVELQNLQQGKRLAIDLPNNLPLQNMVVTTARPISNADVTITLIDTAALHKALPILGDSSALGTPDYPIPEPSLQDYDLKQVFKVDTKITPSTAEEEKYRTQIDDAINQYFADEEKQRRQKRESWVDDAINRIYAEESFYKTAERKAYEKTPVPHVEGWIDEAINQIYQDEIFYNTAVKKAYEQDEKSIIHKVEGWVDDTIKKYSAEVGKNKISEDQAIRDYSLLRSEQKNLIIKDALEQKSAHASALVRAANAAQSWQNEEPHFSNAQFAYTIKDISDDETKHSKLLRYDESKNVWTPLPTQFKNCELRLCHFVSESSGTSYFAIVIEKQGKSSTHILLRTIVLCMLVFFAYRFKKKIKKENKTVPPTIKTRITGAFWGLLLFVAAFFTAFIAIMVLVVVNQIVSPGNDVFTGTDFITAIFVSLAAIDFLIYKHIKSSGKQIMLTYGARDWLKGAMTGLIFSALTHLYSIVI